ncbi:DUF4232 domain-containing protein [Streptomyces sp. NRRL WC-3742]|uniref:DUF4232 domain-containing protein n=1 Tax=Streptomyces sp. NRRL WC-3742 TaxID=1463934 RepID=UPI0004C51B10|nr:DUF4232 domain-containing protein [Streptomyces sp. NRRL WC-3742]
MRRPSRPRSPFTAATVAVSAAAALLTSCGTVQVGSTGSTGSAGSNAEPTSTTTGPSCTPSTGANTPANTSASTPTSTGASPGGIRFTLSGPGCTEYEVTNQGTAPADVTVLLNRLTANGEALENLPHTVTALAPGATDRGRLSLGTAGTGGTPARLKVLSVRSVPSAEAPKPTGDCPASGLRLYADQGDAAMGLRAVGLLLQNCGTTPVTLDGYPQLQLLDLEHQPVDGIHLLSGGTEIATGTGADAPPKRFTLRPGERARSTLVWRNTTQDGAPVNVPYARVRATPTAAPVMVTPEFDLGTTGRLGIGAWQRQASTP